jgi:hypothetical protein
MDRMQIAIVDRDENQVRIWVRVDLTDAEEAPAARPRSPTAQQKAEASVRSTRTQIRTWFSSLSTMAICMRSMCSPSASLTVRSTGPLTAVLCARCPPPRGRLAPR